jgi:S1-C subfamily serine protease
MWPSGSKSNADSVPRESSGSGSVAPDPAPPFIDPLGIPWTGQIILALDSHPVRSMKDLEKRLASHRPGEQAIVTVTTGPGIVTAETVIEREPRPVP